MRILFFALLMMWSQLVFSQSFSYKIHEYPAVMREALEPYSEITNNRLGYTFQKSKYILKREGVAAMITWKNTSTPFDSGNYTISAQSNKYNEVTIKKGMSNATIASFKVINTLETSDGVFASFSMDGKYAFVLSTNNKTKGLNSINIYLYNLETSTLEINGRRFIFDWFKLEKAISINGSSIFLQYGGALSKLNMKLTSMETYGNMPALGVKEEISMSGVSNVEYFIPSLYSDHLIFKTNDGLSYQKKADEYLFDLDKKKFTFSRTNFELYKPKILTYFISTDAKKSSSDIKESINYTGAGIIRCEGSLVVFDNNANYFTHDEYPENNISIADFVEFNESKATIEAQKNIKPFVSDVLGREALAALFGKIDGYAYDSRLKQNSVFNIFEKCGELTEEDIQELYKLKSTKYVYLFIWKRFVEWTNATSIETLALDGLKVNQERKYFIRSTSLNGTEYPKYVAEKSALQAAKDKIEIVSSELYYMKVADLILAGDKAIQESGSLSAKDATAKAIPYYERAAQLEPTEPMHPCRIGTALFIAQNFDLAIKYYNQALYIRPNFPSALAGIYRMARFQFSNGKLKLSDDNATTIKSIAENFLRFATPEYENDIITAKMWVPEIQLYISDKVLYDSYMQAKVLTGTLRISSFEALIPKIASAGNTYLVGAIKYTLAQDKMTLAESNPDPNYPEIDALLAQAILAGQDVPDLYLTKADINMYYLNNSVECLRIIKLAKTKFPKDSRFFALEYDYYRWEGNRLFKAKNYAATITALEQYLSLKLDPNKGVYYKLGESYLMMKNALKANQVFVKLQNAMNANTLKAFHPNFDVVLAYSKNPVGALPRLENNVDMIADLEGKVNKSTQLIENSEFTQAMAILTEAGTYFNEINYDAGQIGVFMRSAFYYEQLKDNQKAKEQYQACIGENPNESDCYANLAWIYIQERTHDKALTILNDAILKFPNDPLLHQTYGKCYADMGFGDFATGNKQSAITNFEKSLNYDDKNALARMSLGLVYYSNGQLSLSQQSIRLALELDPTLRKSNPAIDQILAKSSSSSSSSTSSSSSSLTKRYCYSAVLKKQRGGGIDYAAKFIQITAPADASESNVKIFGRTKVNQQLNGYQIIVEALDLNKECTECKKTVSTSFVLSDFLINSETMR